MIKTYRDGYNSNNMVSMCESPAKTKENWGFMSYCSGNKIVFIAENNDTSKLNLAGKQNVKSGIMDEVFVGWEVELENIVGIVVPGSLQNKNIYGGFLGFRTGDTSYKHIVEQVDFYVKKFELKGDIVNKTLEITNQYKFSEDKKLLNALELVFRKVNLTKNITWLQYIIKNKPKNCKIYDENGLEIESSYFYLPPSPS